MDVLLITAEVGKFLYLSAAWNISMVSRGPHCYKMAGKSRCNLNVILSVFISNLQENNNNEFISIARTKAIVCPPLDLR